MKYTVIEAYGYASVGDVMHCAGVDGNFIEGYLRTRRRYTVFIIPAVCVGAGEDETPEDAEYHARYADPDTAHAEMARMGRKATERELAILAALKARGEAGATSREASELTGIPHVSTSTVMTKMVRKRMLADTTVRRDNAMVRIAIQQDEEQGMLL